MEEKVSEDLLIPSKSAKRIFPMIQDGDYCVCCGRKSCGTVRCNCFAGKL